MNKTPIDLVSNNILANNPTMELFKKHAVPDAHKCKIIRQPMPDPVKGGRWVPDILGGWVLFWDDAGIQAS